jgi:hypothetical protein
MMGSAHPTAAAVAELKLVSSSPTSLYSKRTDPWVLWVQKRKIWCIRTENPGILAQEFYSDLNLIGVNALGAQQFCQVIGSLALCFRPLVLCFRPLVLCFRPLALCFCPLAFCFCPLMFCFGLFCAPQQQIAVSIPPAQPVQGLSQAFAVPDP